MNQINTVAQALRRIKQLKGKIALLSIRVRESVSWVESDTEAELSTGIRTGQPPYDFAAVRTELATAVHELLDLKTRLAIANANTEVDVVGVRMPIQRVVFVLAELKTEKQLVESLAVGKTGTYKIRVSDGLAAYGREPEYATLTYKVAISEVERDTYVAALGEKITHLNSIIEDANHRTELPKLG
jgi:hypothetical protein